MKIKIDNESCFHKVGQGQFFSGKFKLQNNVYNYVVDCGSYNKGPLKIEVGNYIKKLDGEPIDLFIISHFHKDHFCGIFEFKNIEIKKLVLPYLDPIEKIFLCSIILKEKLSKYDKEYIKFILDPTEYLQTNDFNISEIFYIKPNTHEEKKDYQAISGNIIEKDIIYLYDRVSRGNEDTTTNPSDKKSKIITHIYYDLAISIVNYIEFDFYHNLQFEGSLDNFKNSSINEVNIEEYFSNKSVKDIMDELNNKNIRDAIKAAYSKVDRKINNAAICVSITTIAKCNIQTNMNKRDYRFDIHDIDKNLKVGEEVAAAIELSAHPNMFISTNCIYKGFQDIECFGYMFTGDINLNENEKYNALNDFIHHYYTKEKKIFIFTVPHHGSKNNWSRKLAFEFSNSLFIILAGINNQFKHPHFTVCNSIHTSQHQFIWVNESIEFIINYEMEFII